MIARLIVRLRRRLAAEDGVVLLYALGAMLIVAGMTAAALTAVTLDTGGTAADTYQKQAYAAAEAGIQRYLYELNTNNTYWTQCMPSGSNWIVNTGVSGTPQPVPGSSVEKYLVMLLPAAGQNTYTSCNTSDPVDSMIQASGADAGTLRISSTGTSVNASGTTMAQRTVVAAIRQQNFLDYAYFTNYETSDPLVQVDDAFASTNDNDTAIEPPDQCNGAPNCGGGYSAALNGGSYNGINEPGAVNQCTQSRASGRENKPFFFNTYPPGRSYPAQITSDGATTYWPLNDTSGTTASDASNNGNTGTYSSSGVTEGTASPVESSSGKGVTLAGGTVNGNVNQTAPTVYTEEMWFKSTASGGRLATFANATSGGNQDRVLYLSTSGNVVFGVFTGSTVTISSPSAYNNGNWHFVVATQGSDGMHLYIDGQLVASNTTTTAQSFTGSWHLGGVDNSWPGASQSVAFSGSMSDAAWFPTELTAGQVLAEYNASPVSPAYTPPSSGYLLAPCANIEFIGGDSVNGPFHSNDSVLMCGSPTFGRAGAHDSIEFGGDPTVYPNGYLEAPGCSGSPNLASGAVLTPQDTQLNLPTIGQLQSAADYVKSGTTCVNLTTSAVQIASLAAGQSCIGLPTSSYAPYAWSSFKNGVLYVANSSTAQCNYTYDVDDPVYTPTSANVGCGTVFVQGQTQKPLTIAAEQDIVVDGNLTYPSSNPNGAMLGLIATGFIRVYHPVQGGVCTSADQSDAYPSSNPEVTQISAAMLSLAHSFIVDDYSCGGANSSSSDLGTLNVYGSISQNFRGTVGSGNSGYTKSYVYDPRLQYSEPPHFLAPTNGAYAIAYQTECDTGATVVNGTSCTGTS